MKTQAMTAHQLARELLKGPDLPVHFAYNYGDYWKTQVAAAVGEINEGRTQWSEYHLMPKVYAEEDLNLPADTTHEAVAAEEARLGVQKVILLG